jgi:hypothetical protein
MYLDKVPEISISSISAKKNKHNMNTYGLVVPISPPVQESEIVECILGKFLAVLIRVLELVLRLKVGGEDGNSRRSDGAAIGVCNALHSLQIFVSTAVTLPIHAYNAVNRAAAVNHMRNIAEECIPYQLHFIAGHLDGNIPRVIQGCNILHVCSYEESTPDLWLDPIGEVIITKFLDALNLRGFFHNSLIFVKYKFV